MRRPAAPALKVDPRKRLRWVSVYVSAEDVELLHDNAVGMIASNAYPKGTPDYKQPTGWHEGRTLLDLAKRLAAAYKVGER